MALLSPRSRTRTASPRTRRFAARPVLAAATVVALGLAAPHRAAADGQPDGTARPFCPSDDPDLAQEPAPWTPAAVDALLLEGFRERQRGFDEAALVDFVDAYRGSGDARALAQLALAEQALGRPRLARRHLREAVACDEDPWIARNAEVLAGVLDELDAQLARDEAASPTDARSAADGGASPPLEAHEPAPTRGPLDHVPVASWATLGAAGALLVAAIGTGVAQRGAQRDLDAACPDPRACPDGARDDRDRARRLAAATDVLGTASLLAASTAVVLWLLEWHPWDRERAGDGSPRLAAACGPTGCSATLTGSF